MKTSPLVSAFIALVGVVACSSSAQTPFGDPSNSSSGSGSGGGSSAAAAAAAAEAAAARSVPSATTAALRPRRAAASTTTRPITTATGSRVRTGTATTAIPTRTPARSTSRRTAIDEDCDGTADDEPTGCDTNAVLDSTDPFNAALAIDLCRKTTETATGKQRTWGVVDATYIAPDGSESAAERAPQRELHARPRQSDASSG